MPHPPVIGIVGTAKNTGKTTTLSYLMQHAHAAGLQVGITGIGYDGEELDNITFLPKPRLNLPTDTIVTTSERCLAVSTAKFEILERTGIVTSLGQVLILRVTEPGLVVVAGPNRKRTLATIVGKMKMIGVDLLLIDGSLNRIAPMSLADKIIFTTGAARNTETNVLAEEMRTIERAFSLDINKRDLSPSRVITVFEKDKTSSLEQMSLLDSDDVSSLLNKLSRKSDCIYIPGLISSSAMKDFVEHVSGTRLEIILSDPFILLLAGEPLAVSALIELCENKSVHLSFASKPQLTAITINPFYPRPTGTAFAASFVDKKEMMRQMQYAIRTPVFNVQEESGKLFSLCSE